VATPSTPEITSSKLEIRMPSVSQDFVLLLGLAVGVAAAALVPWQLVAIAICIIFIIRLAVHFTTQAKKLSPPTERGAKFGEKKG
jgi:hypothetical protein